MINERRTQRTTAAMCSADREMSISSTHSHTKASDVTKSTCAHGPKSTHTHTRQSLENHFVASSDSPARLLFILFSRYALFGARFYGGAESTKADSHEIEYEMSHEKTLFHIFACRGESRTLPRCQAARQTSVGGVYVGGKQRQHNQQPPTNVTACPTMLRHCSFEALAKHI